MHIIGTPPTSQAAPQSKGNAIPTSTALLHSSNATERMGLKVSTVGGVAFPVSFDYATATRFDFTKRAKQGGVQNQLFVGLLPAAYGIKYDGT